MKEQTKINEPITVVEDEPPTFSWNTVYTQINSGAFSIILFLAVVFWFTRNAVKEGWSQLRQLMSNMSTVNEKNSDNLDVMVDLLKDTSQALNKNAESLRRLSTTNTKVAEAMHKEMDTRERNQVIIAHLQTSAEPDSGEHKKPE